ncbi:PREDICTED: uncharacterized protein LOC107186305 [Dufourea novaeangliae]|uniref:Uncharacterized protein n=1 Tax=Dufourea novaeangliae TaxID=178035 RepID=A0A154P7W8_DUFNO|nr:PREDICTED: uncharacterized protein LOC107186305 [Dufourea novaeangliae]KZC08019.1 hypothetical protein WN55_09082 [Dufourea novaeangliae]
MSCDLLPEWLNLFLDDVETTLCLPILIVMVLCTVQFIFNHTRDIGCTLYRNMKQKCEDEDEDTEKEKGEDLMSKIKGFIMSLGFGQSEVDSNAEGAFSRPIRQHSQEDWDYCDEEDE